MMKITYRELMQVLLTFETNTEEEEVILEALIDETLGHIKIELQEQGVAAQIAWLMQNEDLEHVAEALGLLKEE